MRNEDRIEKFLLQSSHKMMAERREYEKMLEGQIEDACI